MGGTNFATCNLTFMTFPARLSYWIFWILHSR